MYVANVPNDSAISAIFGLRFKNEAYSVNIFILANVPNDSTKVSFLASAANIPNDSTMVAVFLPKLPT